MIIKSLTISFFLFSFSGAYGIEVQLSAASPGNHKGYLNHYGFKRTFIYHIPVSWSKTVRMPLVIALHGGGGQGRHMVRLTNGGFNTLAGRDGFIVVYPDGRNKHWNDGRSVEETGYQSHKENCDDTGFISLLIDYFINEFNVDPRRVYVTGMSNGAMMSYRIGCELSDKVAAIAPVTGNIPQNLLAHCSPSSPVAVLAINNVNDPLMPYGGGDVTGPFGKRKLGKVLSAEASVKFWANRNKCEANPLVIEEPDHDPGDGTRVRRETYTNGLNGTEAILYTIEGGGHTWPSGYQYLPEKIISKTSRDINACEVIWDFFSRHAKR